MLAIRVERNGGPDVLGVADVPVPVPAEGQALIRIASSGINFIDTYQRSGLYKIPLPFTLGQEAAGTVEQAGGGVTLVAPGDRVAYTGAMGAYAEQAVVPADRLVKLPAGVSFDMGAAAMLQGMTAHYLVTTTYRLGAGKTCLVHAAAGGVGLLLVQMAKRAGATVIGTTGDDAKAKLAREAGADHVILYRTEDVLRRVKEITDGRGVDVVYDGVGKATFDASLQSVAKFGLLAMFGNASGAVPPFDVLRLQDNARFLARPRLGEHIATRQDLESRAGEVLGWIAAGKLKIRIHRRYPLRDAAQAHRDLEGRQTSGKLLLVP